MDTVSWSRLLTAETLAFHIVWATIGVGVPIFICIAEGWGLYKKDHHYLLMARRWTRGFVITVAVGVVTGTCIGFMLSLLWPNFMRLVGNVISLPLFLETFAFFFEAIFLGIYLYTWDRFKNPWIHWGTSIPIVIGSTMSAVFITMVNAFQNTPAGLKMDAAKKIIHIDPLAAMFNPATPSKVIHVVSTSYLACGLLLASIGAFHLLRKRTHVYYKKAVTLTVIVSMVLAFLTVVTGDISAKFLAQYQPAKLAAMEWHFETTGNAPLVVGGTLDKDTLEIKNAIYIPSLLSFLAHGDRQAEVIGLRDIPRDLWPPLYIHTLFDLMVGIGFYIVFICSVFFFLRWRKKGTQWNKWVLWGLLLSGPLAFVAIECGWIAAEVGRQPWIIVGLMKVREAGTAATNVSTVYFAFTTLYLLLAVIAVSVLTRLFRNNHAEKELAERGTIL